MPRAISTTTTVGKLRSILGLSAKQFAEKCNLGASTIQKIEQGKHPLSYDAARRIGMATFVDLEWLLDGKPDIPPKLIGGAPFDKATSSHLSFLMAHPEMQGEGIEKTIRTRAKVILKMVRATLDLGIANGKAFETLFELDAACRQIQSKVFKKVFGTPHVFQKPSGDLLLLHPDPKPTKPKRASSPKSSRSRRRKG